jgi:hypothetical protein
MNPEFRRQVWLHVSAERLVATPVILALIFVLVGVLDNWNEQTLAGWALALAAAISGWLGVVAAVESFAAESRARTWDWQRLSGVGPWRLVWGKLLGATLPAHYGALCAYAVFLFVGGLGPAGSRQLVLVPLCFTGGLLMQSIGMLIAAWSVVSQRPQASPATSHLLGAAASFSLMVPILFSAERRSGYPAETSLIQWYELQVPLAVFQSASMFVLFCWCVLASYRLVRDQLDGPLAPWGTPVFSMFIAGYAAGFVVSPLVKHVHGLSARLLAGQAAAAAIAYALCLGATMGRVELTRWLLALRGDKRSAWVHTPAWIAGLLPSVPFGILVAATSGIRAERGELAPAMGIVLALLTLRDAGLLLALRLRGGPLASDAWCFVFCACLHVVAPMIAVGLEVPRLRSVLSLDPKGGWTAVWIVICEILLIVQWIRMAWSRPARAI